jgi:hypothetical protein
MIMATSRLPRIAAAAASVGIVAAAWFLGAAPQIEAARLARTDTAAVDVANDALRARLVILRDQHARITTIRADLAAAAAQLPPAPTLPDLVDEITAIAAANHVAVTSYRAEESLAPLADAAAAAAVVEPAEPVDPAEPAAPVDDAGASPANASAPVSPTVPTARLTANNFYAIPITLTLRGTATDTLVALDQIQAATRVFLVTSARVVARDEEDSGVDGDPGVESSEVRGYVFVLTGS